MMSSSKLLQQNKLENFSTWLDITRKKPSWDYVWYRLYIDSCRSFLLSCTQVYYLTFNQIFYLVKYT